MSLRTMTIYSTIYEEVVILFNNSFAKQHKKR